MNWFLIGLIGYALLAVVFILDKFIVSKAVKPVVYAFYSTIFMFGALLALPIIGFNFLHGIDWWWAIISGLGYGLGLWSLYIAVNLGEASHINPFNGGIVTIFIFVLSSLFLSEHLSSWQTFGIFVLVLSSLLLSFEKSQKHHGFHIGFVWAILSALFFAVSHVTAKYLYGQYDFWTAFVWSKAMTGLVGVILLLSPAVWHSFRRDRSKEAKTYAHQHSTFLIVSDKIISVLAIIFIQYAMSAGSVTVVGAIAGVQYALMFIMIYLLTKFLPKVFKEYFTKREIIVEIIALTFVIVGSIFLI